MDVNACGCGKICEFAVDDDEEDFGDVDGIADTWSRPWLYRRTSDMAPISPWKDYLRYQRPLIPIYCVCALPIYLEMT